MSSFEVDPVAGPNLGDAARAEQLDPHGGQNSLDSAGVTARREWDNYLRGGCSCGAPTGRPFLKLEPAGPSQREKAPGPGASGQRVGNRVGPA